MGTITLNKQNRLFWLGRYAERVYSTVQYMMEQYDSQLDGSGGDYIAFCTGLGIPCPYTDGADFVHRYLFDKTDPNSVASTIEYMLGNGMVLRETISTPTLAYLQMAQNAMQIAAQSETPMLALQWVLDDIMAFRGSFDDNVEVESARNITKTGGLVERISVILRLNPAAPRLEREIQKLVNRVYKTDLPRREENAALLADHATGTSKAQPTQLLYAVENLFCV